MLCLKTPHFWYAVCHLGISKIRLDGREKREGEKSRSVWESVLNLAVAIRAVCAVGHMIYLHLLIQVWDLQVLEELEDLVGFVEIVVH